MFHAPRKFLSMVAEAAHSSRGVRREPLSSVTRNAERIIKKASKG